MDEERAERRRRLAELAAEDRRKRTAAEPEIARKEAALARERSELQRLDDENALLDAELDTLRSDPADDARPPLEKP